MPKKAWVDALVLGIVLICINLVFSESDPGWLSVNPSPYLLVSVLVGARYGSTAAFYTACTSVVVILLLAQFAERPMPVRLFLAEHTYLLFSFFLFGVLSGEVHAFFRRKSERFHFLYEEARDRLRKLDADIKKIAQINNKLQREVLNSDNQTFSLDIEIRGLYECPTEDLWIKTLLVLNRMERITNAAVYSLPADGTLNRLAILGKDKVLPMQLELDSYLIIQKALRTRQVVAIPEVLGDSSAEREPFLFVMPLRDVDDTVIALAIVAEMPFMSFHPRNLRRIDLIASWAAEIIDLRIHESTRHYRVLSGPENKRIFMQEYFRAKLQLSFRTAKQHEIPSTVILIRPEDPQALDQGSLEQAVIKRVRTGDFAAMVESSTPHVCVLLPFTAQRGGQIFIESCQGMIRGRFPDFPPIYYELIEVKDYDSFDGIWNHILQTLRA